MVCFRDIAPHTPVTSTLPTHTTTAHFFLMAHPPLFHPLLHPKIIASLSPSTHPPNEPVSIPHDTMPSDASNQEISGLFSCRPHSLRLDCFAVAQGHLRASTGRSCPGTEPRRAAGLSDVPGTYPD